MPVHTPSPPKKLRKDSPSTANETRGNISKPEPDKTVALNFRVPAEVKRNFKIVAATHGITQSKLLIEAFNAWQAKHG